MSASESEILFLEFFMLPPMPSSALFTTVYRFVFSLLVAVVLLAGPVNAEGRRMIISKGADYFGGDYRTLKKVPLDECKKVCLGDEKCKAFTYNRKAHWCFLKSSVGELKTFAGATAGRVVGQKKADVAELEPAKKLKYVGQGTYNSTTKYEQTVIKRHGKKAVTDEAAVSLAQTAEQNGNFSSSSGYWEQAAGINPKSFRNWLNLARTVLAAKPKDKKAKYQFPRVGAFAALQAYSLSRTTSGRAEALGYFAEGMARRTYYRQALEAYKDSLALVGSRVLSDKFAKLRAAHGFRIVKHTVDADSTAPRICVQFSENLVKTTDYASFMSIDGKTPKGIDVEQRQLCLNGVKHGQRYTISFRAGLPSEYKDEPLEKSATLNVFVRDRSAFLRFTGANFVLPRIGSKGIPVVSVNTKQAKVTLYRIGAAALNEAIKDGKFLKAQDGYSLDDIEENVGTKIWSGTLDISPVLNKEVTTSFPVNEALPERKPGVYVMIATPFDDKSEEWRNRATQWFVVSDIGLTTLSGNDGLHVFARSLSTAEPMADVEIQLFTHSSELLGTGKTDSSGYVKLDAGLLRGKNSQSPGLVLARRGKGDFVLVDLRKGSIDLSDRGVMGRASPGPLDAYLFTERGIYRPGEQMHITALLRDDRAKAVSNVPLTVKLERPDGKLEVAKVVKGRGAGGHSLSYQLQKNAMLGTWVLRLYADPKGDALVEKRLLVEDFIPDRIEFDLSASDQLVSRTTPTKFNIEGRYLYGVPADIVSVEGVVQFLPINSLDDFKGFVFGLDDEKSTASVEDIAGLDFTDENGKASFELVSSLLPDKAGLFKARVTVKMSEYGGRAVERSLTLPIAPAGNLIGIRPLFGDGSVEEGQAAEFEVIAIGPDRKRLTMSGLKWKLVKLERRYQWYSSDGGWSYEPVLSTKKIAAGQIDVTPDNLARIAAPVQWGRYRLEISAGDDGPVSSVSFNAGWWVETSSTETPDGLEIALDKNIYSPGSTARVNISPRFAGKALITVGSENLLWSKSIAVEKSGAVVEIPVGENWGAGAYVNVTMYRPGDAKASRMPSRAIGIKWLKVDPGPRKIEVKLELPEKTTPRKNFDVPVTLVGLPAGQEAFVTVAAVDIGILNLTRYKPPQPAKWYFGQRQLGLEVRDIYGKLIDGFAGTTGVIRSGGDEASGLDSKGSPPTQKLVSFYSGIVKVDDNGKAVIRFDMPQFNGTVRVMAVAWSKNGVGSASGDVIVRDPIVLTATVPRFLTPGDKTGLRLDIANTDGPAGDYQLVVETFGKLEAGIPVAGMTVSLKKGERRAVSVPVRALRVGKGVLAIRLSSATGPTVEQALAVPVRAPMLPVSERRVVKLAAKGGQISLDSDFFAGYTPGSASMSVGVSRAAGLDVPSLLLGLDRYPYGCAEQTTSRALPLLYLSEVAGQTGLGDDPAIRKRVQGAINRVIGFQAAAGSFGMWAPGSDNLWLDAYVSDFLTRAREQGFEVPKQAMMLALDNLSNSLSYDVNLSEQGNEIAYALYVLARNKRASISDLRYFVGSKLSQFKSPLAKAQLAAALGLYGESVPATRAFNAAYSAAITKVPAKYTRDDYGTSLRDRAAILALAAEARPAMSFVSDMVSNVSSARLGKRYTSTQEKAWLLLAARSLYANSDKIRLEVNGQMHKGNLARKLSVSDVDAGLSITNKSDESLEAAITVSGVPVKPLPAGGSGFSIVREYYTEGGEKVGVSTVAQNERFVVVLKIKELNSWGSRIVVQDLLPAGFEIDNPSLISSAVLGNFEWLKRIQPAHTEFRSDRFVAAFNRSASDDREIKLAYVVRAISPGKYIHPAAVVEDMYRPHLSARTAQGTLEVVGPKP
jgi:uncharacterized protein YfaS (alpha-2-macroglobulin family)